MGLRYRKSISLGKGIRVNISKSGIGYSFGVPGARITKTATGKTRQTYSIPGTGISYVTESGSSSNNTSSKTAQNYEEVKFANATDNLNYDNLGSGIYDAEIKRVILGQKTYSGLFVVSVILAILGLITNPLLLLLAVGIFISSLIILFTKGKLDIEYTLDTVAQKQYDELCDTWKSAFNSIGIWQISQTCITNDKKDNCGAKAALKPVAINNKIRFRTSSIVLRTNIKPFYIPIVDDKGKFCGEVILLPDRVLIHKGTTLVAVEPNRIKTTVSVQPMAAPTPELCPNDAKIAEYKYIHENSDGTPDRRYKDNPQLPIVHYGRIDVETNGSTIVSLLFSNLSKLESIESKLLIENLSSDYSIDSIDTDINIDYSNDTNANLDSIHSSSKTNEQSSTEQQTKPFIYEEAVKKVKKTFAICIGIAFIIALILVIIMHDPADGIGMDIMMTIFCTIALSIPTSILALALTIKDIKQIVKYKKEQK